ncbi:TIGR03621 family F420-dependent LLM class oxidoreductase [Actinoallomurus sp. NPDC052308]|uniref:TIGR03621 family F420-dependent LLM class oxidoreductase n=1 Tax=Actinoallomurus sp. NPDC052308 TaxID=3155530 RepID=UPI003447A513
MGDFRFSFVLLGTSSHAELVERCQEAERLGYDTVFAADHLGVPAPFPTLVAAAAATRRLRVGTLVLNAPFWNPALLAREVATTDLLTDGRLEVGLGAGYVKWEFDEAGIAWEPFGARADRLEATVDELTRLFAAGGYERQAALRESYGFPVLAPVQRRGFAGSGPPLLIGGMGDRTLRIAAERADIVGISGTLQVKGQPLGTLRLATAAQADERVRYARECAGARADRIEWQTLVQAVRRTGDRRAVAEELSARYGGAMSAEEVLDTPFLLIGTVEEMAERILRDRERYGFTYYTVHAPFIEEFAPVIERVRALARGRHG